MRSNRARIAVAVGAIAAIVVLFVVLSGGNDNNDNKSSSGAPAQGTTSQAGQPANASPPAVINVIGGKPAGGIQKLDYTKGEQVRFKVNSDVSDEIHVHGYDFHKDVTAGGSVSFSFPAKIEGVFVVELEAKGEQIAELRVRPS
jgi:FtsP/CotA-like multicopper oxidase with cupredoxin domain